MVAAVTGRVSAWNDLREGVVLIWNTPSLMAIIWLVLLFNFTAFPLTNGLLPYVAREIYLVDQAGLWLSDRQHRLRRDAGRRC